MPGLSNNLYPPIFEKSYIPAFIRGEGCKVYFSLSPYNGIGNIRRDSVQVIVQNQKTNQSVLDKKLYPSGIKVTSLMIDNENAERQDKYYIVINNSDISNGFNFNQYYKVQIRFASSQATKANNTKLDAWLSQNLNKISQWSTVVLIKPISQPNISISQFNFDSTSASLITNNNLTIAGTVKPSQTKDYQKMKSYQIFIYDDNGFLLEDSGKKYFYDSNQILYNCKYNFQSGSSYVLKIQIITNNLYKMQKTAKFNVSYTSYSNLDAIISATIDKVEGCAIITLKNEIASALGTNIVIRRSSNETNFLYWEDVYTTLVTPNTFLNLTWKDYTIESGVWYKYSAVKRNANNYRSNSIEINTPILADFEDIFLTTSQKQLKIRFNPQINNYSRVVSESLVQTIGSKYPFIRRNSKIGYRTFSISGTISYLSDVNQNLMHASVKNIYNETASLYENYNTKNNITLYNDIIQQKIFREKVLDFLYDNNVKLYRSETEGNILVKLMNISFTPNTTLSRQIYDFTCTAYEIDDFTYENCVKYNIQDEGFYVNEDSFLITRYGQLIIPQEDRYWKETNDYLKTIDSYYFGKQELITNKIEQKFKKLESENLQIEVHHLSYLKIQLTSPPYLITQIGNSLIPASSTDNIICSGHIVNINGQSIIIGADGIYELSGDNVYITSLNFESPEQQGVIDFEVVLEEKEKRKLDDFKDYSSYSRIGQLWGSFNLRDNLTLETIYSKIINKYTFTDNINQTQQQIQNIKGLRITAEPGTVVYVKENQDSSYDKHILNETGVLEFFDDDTNIKGIYFEKPVLKEINKETMISRGLASDEFYDTKEVITSDTFKNPKNNCIYHFAPVNLDKKVIKLTAEEQIILDTLQQNSQNFNNSGLYSNELIQKRILGWKTNKEKAEEIDSKTLGLKYDGFDKYIFYNGSWYQVKEQNVDGSIEVNIPNVEAIIDYYCDILRKRY